MPAFSGQIPVCMRCGGRDIRPQSSGDGLWPGGGEGIAWVCDVCHHIGAPLLVTAAEVNDTRDDLWQQEAADAAFALDEEAWAASAPPRRGRLLGIILVVLGAVFVVPALLALEASIESGDPMVALRTLLPVAWLGAVGTALLAVGMRRLRQRPDDPRAQDAA